MYDMQVKQEGADMAGKKSSEISAEAGNDGKLQANDVGYVSLAEFWGDYYL